MSKMIYGNHNKDVLLQDFNIRFQESDTCLFDDTTIWYKKDDIISIYHYGRNYCVKYMDMIVGNNTWLETSSKNGVYYMNNLCSGWKTYQIYHLDRTGRKTLIDTNYESNALFAYGDIYYPCLAYLKSSRGSDIEVNVKSYHIKSNGASLFYLHNRVIHKLHRDGRSESVVNLSNTGFYQLYQVSDDGLRFVVANDIGIYSISIDGDVKVIHDKWDIATDESCNKSLFLYSPDHEKMITYDITGQQHYKGRCIKMPNIAFHKRTYSSTYSDISIISH